jgi:hypothetical protein
MRTWLLSLSGDMIRSRGIVASWVLNPMGGKSQSDPIIKDEAGIEERFQRALRKALDTPPKAL